MNAGDSRQPAGVSARGTEGARSPRGRGEPSLLILLWRERSWLLAAVALSAVLGVLVSLILPSTYRATALVILTEPVFSERLSAPAISAKSFELIGNAESIKGAALHGFYAESADQSGGIESKDLTATVLEGSRTLRLRVDAPVPEAAKRVADLWAEEVRSVTDQIQGRNALVFTQAHPDSQSKLDQAEEDLTRLRNQVDGEYLERNEGLERRMSEFSQISERLLLELALETEAKKAAQEDETARLVQEHKKETERLRLHFLDEHKPDSMKQEAARLQARLIQLETDLSDTRLARRLNADRTREIESEIRKQPQRLVLSKAIADEAIWERIARSDAGLPAELADQRLRSEVFNPVRQSLDRQLAEARIQNQTLLPKETHLDSEIKRVRQRIDELSQQTTDTDIRLMELLKERDLGLSDLTRERMTDAAKLALDRRARERILTLKRQLGQNLLEASQKNAVATSQRDADLQIGRLERLVESVQSTYKAVDQPYGAALLSLDQRGVVIDAGLPAKPEAPGMAFLAAIGALLGLAISMAVIAFRDYLRRFSTPTTERELQ